MRTPLRQKCPKLQGFEVRCGTYLIYFKVRYSVAPGLACDDTAYVKLDTYFVPLTDESYLAPG
jgi:hypothetical protein